MSDDCLFCRIVRGEIPSDTVYEDADVLAFRDIAPQAPVHVLVVPKRHFVDLDAAADTDRELLGSLLRAAARVAASCGISGAYRVVNNCGAAAGQSVFHIHLHVLGGRGLAWPPG